jgi:Apea-like HEPN
MIYRSVHLIANAISIEEMLPINLEDDLTLRRASDFEIQELKNLIRKSTGDFSTPFTLYESIISPAESDGFSYSYPGKDNWNYYVFSDDKGGSSVYKFHKFLLLLDPSLELSARIVLELNDQEDQNTKLGKGTHLIDPHLVERYYGYMTQKGLRSSFILEDFRKIADLKKRLNNLDKKYEFIKDSFDLLWDSRNLKENSKFRVISYFSIIEGLLTHKPKPNLSDSLTHQLVNKLNLMINLTSNRSVIEGKLGIDSNKIIKDLYDYRSAIAHGSKIKSKYFKSENEILKILSSITKILIIYSIENPEFIFDLKEC